MSDQKPRRRGNRIFAGVLVAALFAVPGWYLHELFGLPAVVSAGAAAGVGFVIGYAMGLFLVEVVFEIFS